MPFQIIRSDSRRIEVDGIIEIHRKDSFAAGSMFFGLRDRRTTVTLFSGQNAKYLIRTLGPVWRGGGSGEPKKLRRCFRDCLRLAKKSGCESIAFPLSCKDELEFPKGKELEIFLEEVRGFLSREDMLIYLVVPDGEPFSLPGELFSDMDSYLEDRFLPDTGDECFAAEDGGVEGVGQIRQKAFRNMPSMQMAHSMPSAFTAKMADRSLEDVMAQIGETFQERLFRLIDQRRLSDVEVYKKANLDRKLFSKIRCNRDYRPKKITAVALAVALELNLDETKDLLSRAEMALSPSNRFDLIITYFLERKIYDIYTINLALFQHGQPMLGA